MVASLCPQYGAWLGLAMALNESRCPLDGVKISSLCLVMTHLSPQSTPRPQRYIKNAFSAPFARSAVNKLTCLAPCE